MWSIRFVALAAAVLVGLVCWRESAEAATVSGPGAVVTEIRVGNHGNRTRFVLDLSGGVTAEVFTLANPYRIVIDLPEIGWRLPTRPLPQMVGLFDKVRYGLFKPGTTRVVIETTQPARIVEARLLGPDADGGRRLMLDFVQTDHASYVTASKAGRSSFSISDAPDLTQPLDPEPAAEEAPSVVAVALPFALPPRKPLIRREKPVVVLDPGHGGVDPGALGASGTYEKHITLSAAREFKDLLEKTGRYRVILTRERDIFIPLRDRVAFAREAGAELFISLHADSIKRKNVRGLSVYTLSETASDKEAADLAESENKADLIAGVDLSHETPEVTNILIDLAQRETMNESAHFASLMVKELGRQTRLLRNTHRFAGFRVLKAPDIPSILVEMGFLSNRQDERDLQKKSYRAKLGTALVEAVDHYFMRVEEAQRR